MELNRKVQVTLAGVQHRARKYFRVGKYTNPYGDGRLLTDLLQAAMALEFDAEIERLKTEKLCPSCGQTTYSDSDF